MSLQLPSLSPETGRVVVASRREREMVEGISRPISTLTLASSRFTSSPRVLFSSNCRWSGRVLPSPGGRMCSARRSDEHWSRGQLAWNRFLQGGGEMVQPITWRNGGNAGPGNLA